MLQERWLWPYCNAPQTTLSKTLRRSRCRSGFWSQTVRLELSCEAFGSCSLDSLDSKLNCLNSVSTLSQLCLNCSTPIWHRFDTATDFETVPDVPLIKRWCNLGSGGVCFNLTGSWIPTQTIFLVETDSKLRLLGKCADASGWMCAILLWSPNEATANYCRHKAYQFE